MIAVYLVFSLFSYIEHNDKKYLHTYIVDITI